MSETIVLVSPSRNLQIAEPEPKIFPSLHALVKSWLAEPEHWTEK